MKKIMVIMSLLLMIANIFAIDIMTKTLNNGMEVVVKKNTSNQSVGLFCFVRTGSLTEGKYLGTGISHHLEHVVSGGSTTLHSEEYYGQKEKEIGAMTNAYTTYDKTAFHTQVDKEYFSIALKMLSEHLQFCAFDTTEVAREQKVIAKEIVMRSTPPYSRMFQRYNEKTYANTNDKYPVIGYVDQFLKLQRKDLVDYYNKRYAPNNMVFVVSGNIDVEKCMQEIEETFNSFPRKTLIPEYLPKEPVVIGTRSFTEEFEIKLPYVLINQVIPESDFKDYYALQATIDILFSKQYSPLQMKLYNDLQLVNYLYAYTDISQSAGTGKLSIGLEAKDTAKLQEIINIMFSELKKYQKGYFTQDQLNTLIHRYEAEHLLKDLSIEDECNEIGENVIQYGVPDNFDNYISNMKKLSPADLNYIVTKYFNPNSKFYFYAIPNGQSAQLVQNDKKNIKTDLIKKDLGNGLTLIHKENSQIPVVRFTIKIPVSTDMENENNAGYLNTMAQMIIMGSKKYDLQKITNILEDKAATMNVSASRDGINFNFTCLKSDLPLIKDILLSCFKTPAFSEDDFNLYKEAQNADSQRALSDPETAHTDFRSKMIYVQKRDALNTEEKNNNLQKMTRDDLISYYNNYFKAESALVSIIGDQSLSEASELANTIFNAINHQKVEAKLMPLKVTVKNQVFTQEYPFEQVNLDINMQAPTTKDNDIYTLKVISSILNGSNGRIHKATRGSNDLSYFAYGYDVTSPDYGIFRVTSQTSVEKAEQLKTVLLNEIDKLIKEKVTQSEINGAIDENQKQMNNYITDKEIGSYALYYESQGLGFDYLVNSTAKLKSVTPEDVQRVAKKYFTERDVIISFPAKELKRMVEEKE